MIGKRKKNPVKDSPKNRKKQKVSNDEIDDIEDLGYTFQSEEIENIRNNLLSWYDNKEEREMPWRISQEDWETQKSNVNEDSTSDSILTQRAYEVWVSEVMLQQTRLEH